MDTKTRPKRKQNDLIPMGCRKSSSKRKITAIQTYLKKTKRRISNKPTITLHLNLLEKEQAKPKFSKRDHKYGQKIIEMRPKKTIAMV